MHSPLLDEPGQAPPGSSEAYRRLLERLYALARGGSKFGLERLAGLLSRLDHPERACPMVHVAGSNGKGSTSAFAASILAAAGRRVGLFTSPHLVSLTERIQIVDSAGFRAISQNELLEAADEVEAVEPGFGEVSFFEVMTAIGLVAFRRAGVGAAVIEAGLGARLDSTRLVEAQVAVLTDLSLEHTSILGDSIEAIAAEEGAVIRPGCPLVQANGPVAAMAVVDQLIAEAQAWRQRIGDEIDLEAKPGGFILRLPGLESVEVRPPLFGAHQGRNALLAAAAARALDAAVDEAHIRLGVERTVWPGRMEVLERPGHSPVLLDGAQNPHAARAFSRALADTRFSAPRHFVFGVLEDKDVGRMLEVLAPRAASFTLTRPGSTRAREPREVARVLTERVGYEGPVDVAEGPSEALVRASRRADEDEGWVVVCGSLYLVGDVRAEILGGGPAR